MYHYFESIWQVCVQYENILHYPHTNTHISVCFNLNFLLHILRLFDQFALFLTSCCGLLLLCLSFYYRYKQAFSSGLVCLVRANEKQKKKIIYRRRECRITWPKVICVITQKPNWNGFWCCFFTGVFFFIYDNGQSLSFLFWKREKSIYFFSFFLSFRSVCVKYYLNVAVVACYYDPCFSLCVLNEHF